MEKKAGRKEGRTGERRAHSRRGSTRASSGRGAAARGKSGRGDEARPRPEQARGSSIGPGAAMRDAGPPHPGKPFGEMGPPRHPAAVEGIVARYGGNPSRVIAMMQDMQEAFGYLPEGDLRLLSEATAIPLNHICGIATFYKAFRLAPRGRHEIKLCTGTACHVRGAEVVRDAITRELGIREGETTADGRFSFETVHCLGCCGLAPVVMIDDDIHGKVGYSVKEILEKYR